MDIIIVALMLLATSLWIFLPRKKVAEDIRVKTSKYILSIVMSFFFCTLLIAILELIWDKVMNNDPADVVSIANAFLQAFLRAALIEEAMKYLFVRRTLKKVKPVDKLQYILLAGTVGMGYALIEKVANGVNAFSFVGVVFVGHIIFQFIMGAYMFDAAKARETDAAKARGYEIKAFFVPFLFHGIWDVILMICQYYSKGPEDSLAFNLAIIATLILMVASIVFEIFVIKYLIRLGRNNVLLSQADEE